MFPMSPLLVPIVIFLISWIDWWIYGKKGMALLNRSPWLIFWSCLEVLLGTIMGFGLYDAFVSKSIIKMVAITVATIAGCAVGCITSGVVKWKK